MVNDYKIALERLQRKRATTRDITLYFEDEETNEAIIEEVAIYNKLYEHENQEEELGIELLTLIKALENGVYYKQDDEVKFWTVLSLTSCHGKLELYFNDKFYYFKDYGKTWALTKVVLEYFKSFVYNLKCEVFINEKTR